MNHTSVRAMLDSKTEKTADCWLWTGGVGSTGYGRMYFAAKPHLAHRIAFELANGPIPAGRVIDHMCHVRNCVRPDHLQAVTHGQNAENRSGCQANSSTGVRGVYWRAGKGRYQVIVRHEGKAKSGGLFRSIEDAKAAAVALRNSLHSNNLADRAAAEA